MEDVPVRFDGFDGLECPHCRKDTFAFVVAPMDESADMQIWVTKREDRDEFVEMIEREAGIELAERDSEDAQEPEEPELGLTL